MSGEADTIREALALQCQGCDVASDGRLMSISDGCTIHGNAGIALAALDVLVAENERYRALIAAHRQEFIVECEMRGYQDAADLLADFERDALAGRGDA